MATVIRNQNLFCTCCGGEHPLAFPLAITAYTEKSRAFETLHKDCPQTWIEPAVDQSQTTQEKAMWWIANGHVGMSSKTMWNCLIGNKGYPVNHPYDPDDFSRCYKLLEAVPEWKTKLHKLKPLSKAWSNLVDNWDTLTQMYEQNKAEGWKNHEKIGMYELMESLISETKK